MVLKMGESVKMASMIELVKNISNKGINQELVCTKYEYEQLRDELHKIDKFLKEKYLVSTSIPHIYSLFGVKIIVI